MKCGTLKEGSHQLVRVPGHGVGSTEDVDSILDGRTDENGIALTG